MSLGAWIFLSVVVFVVAQILFTALAFVFLWWRGKKLVRKLEKEFDQFDKE